MCARVLTGAVLILLSWLLAGCASARFIQVDQGGGVIAIPENSNVWPTYYRDKAEALLREKCPRGFDIVREEEVVTGQVAHTDTKTTNSPPPGVLVGGVLAVPLGESEQQVQQTTHYRDQTEWRIHFRAK